MGSLIVGNGDFYLSGDITEILHEMGDKPMHIQTSNQEALQLGFRNYSCNWGSHICGLYDTEEDRDEIIFGYLHQGDLDNDLMLYSPCERTQDDFQEKYGALYPEWKDHVYDHSRFQLYSAKQLYYPEGIFSPWLMEEGLEAFFRKSQQNGAINIRATAEMVWALEAIPGVEYLMAYESRLNYFIPGKPWISICLYNVNKFSGAVIMDVLKTHPYTISGGIITENPYFQNPDTWLAKNYPDFLKKN